MTTPRKQHPQDRPRGAPITLAQQAERLEWVEEELAKLPSAAQFERAFAARFSSSTRTAKRYKRKVHERWEAEAAADGSRAHRRAEIVGAARTLYRSALASGELRTAGHSLELAAKIDGLLAPTSIDVKHSGELHHRHGLDLAAAAALIAEVAGEAEPEQA